MMQAMGGEVRRALRMPGGGDLLCYAIITLLKPGSVSHSHLRLRLRLCLHLHLCICHPTILFDALLVTHDDSGRLLVRNDAILG